MHWLLYTTPGFVVLLVSFVVLGALLYALPTLLAFALGLSGIGRIALINLLVAWTFVGWIAQVVWVLRAGLDARDREEPQRREPLLR